MASFDWFPWYPVHYRRATRHLTDIQDLIYRRLIDEYMETREPLPDNDIALASIARVSLDVWTMARAIVVPFFRQTDGKLWHKKCDEILDEQSAVSEKKARAGAAGAAKRWNKTVDKPDENSSSQTVAIADRMANDGIVQDKTVHNRKEEGEVVVKDTTLFIKLFDEVILQVFGSELQRGCPAADDKVFSNRWLELGIEPTWCRDFFVERMTSRKASGKSTPNALRWLKDAVPESWAAFIATKTNAATPKFSRGKPCEEAILKTTSVAEKQRHNEILQRFQSGGRA